MYSAKVVAHSVNPAGIELISIECSYPLIVHAQILRHRVFSSSVASSRAIPTRLIIRAVIDDPYVPEVFTRNRPGMVASEVLTGWRHWISAFAWRHSRWLAIAVVLLLNTIGVHKELANRLLIPWQWVTHLITATDWDNFFALREHDDTQGATNKIARMMREAIDASTPRKLRAGQWHLPMLRDWEETDVGLSDRDKAMIVGNRCARATIDQLDRRLPPKDEIAKSEQHLRKGHLSLFEHPCQALADDKRVANLRGYRSYRSTIKNEHDFSLLVNAGDG